MPHSRRLWSNGSGATALEFALVAPVLILAMIGIFNIGYAIHCGSSVRNAVEQSSRMLIANPATTATSLQTKAKTLLTSVPIDTLTVKVATETVTGTVQVKRVSWTYNYILWIPFMDQKTLAMGSSVVVPLATTT